MNGRVRGRLTVSNSGERIGPNDPVRAKGQENQGEWGGQGVIRHGGEEGDDADNRTRWAKEGRGAERLAKSRYQSKGSGQLGSSRFRKKELPRKMGRKENIDSWCRGESGKMSADEFRTWPVLLLLGIRSFPGSKESQPTRGVR